MVLLNRLRREFDETALEDGYDHPVEALLEEAIIDMGRTALDWIRSAVLAPGHPAFGASLLRCLGRLREAGDSQWRSEIIQSALASDSIELRDAAVQATEDWEDLHLLPVLRSHEEPVPWLKNYVDQVLQDLSE